MTDTTAPTPTKIETVTELFNQLAKYGVAKVEVHFSGRGRRSEPCDDAAWDESGNKIDLQQDLPNDEEGEIGEALMEAVLQIAYERNEDGGLEDTLVTFDLKERRIILTEEPIT